MQEYGRHLASLHGSKKKFECEYEGCEKSFSQKTLLTIHLLLHKNAKPHKCNHCKYASNVKGSVTRHIRSKLSSCRPYKCFYSKSFAFKIHLKVHWKFVHRGQVMKIQLKNGLVVAQNDVK